MLPQPPRTSYDELPYPSYPFPQTHPDHLATVATLLGLSPAPADRCDVLELGCASGGNLIPMALTAPDSTFVGIDLSGEQVAQGQRLIDALGLTNVHLYHLGILDLDDSSGPFDYVLCHGVFSWVDRPVQDRILSICRRQLRPHGIGYVSYNTLPGWHMRGMIRDMMCYHTGRFPADPPTQRVSRARSLLDFLVRATPATAENPYGLFLAQQLNQLRQCSDAYLFHEHLEEYNEPIYFLQFCERLAQHGLRYLGEAEFRMMMAGVAYPPEIRRELHQLAPNLIEKEQYLDFVRNRMFRQTLLCHAEVQPTYQIGGEQPSAFQVASRARPVGAVDCQTDSPADFHIDGGMNLRTSAPLVKAAMLSLGEIWPKPLPFNDLLRRARSRLGRDPDAEGEEGQTDRGVLGRALLTAYANADGSLIELSLRPASFSTELSEHPIASPLARLQAGAATHATNLRHESVALTPLDRHLLPCLDGTRDRAGLLEALLERFRRQDLHITRDEQPVSDESRAREIFTAVLDRQLPALARSALLLG